MYQRLRGDIITHFANIYYKHNSLTKIINRSYRETRSGYLVLDRGIRPHGSSTQTERDPRVNLWYNFQGVIYRKTKAGEVTVEEDLILIRHNHPFPPEYRLKQDKGLDGSNEEENLEEDKSADEEEHGDDKEAEEDEEEEEEEEDNEDITEEDNEDTTEEDDDKDEEEDNDKEDKEEEEEDNENGSIHKWLT